MFFQCPYCGAKQHNTALQCTECKHTYLKMHYEKAHIVLQEKYPHINHYLVRSAHEWNNKNFENLCLDMRKGLEGIVNELIERNHLQKRESLYENINVLFKNGIISDVTCRRYTTIRKTGNSNAHALMPGESPLSNQDITKAYQIFLCEAYRFVTYYITLEPKKPAQTFSSSAPKSSQFPAKSLSSVSSNKKSKLFVRTLLILAVLFIAFILITCFTLFIGVVVSFWKHVFSGGFFLCFTYLPF